MKSAKKINKKNFLILILFLFATNFMSLKTFKNVYVHDIKISGSKLFSKNDLVNNSSLKFPTRLLFIKTNFLEKELKQNLSLKNISVSRQIFPFGLNFHIQTRTPIAYGEKILNDARILGFVDKDGIFIEKQNVNEKNWGNLTIEVVGWKEKFKKILSKIFISQNNYEFEIVKIIFSQNGFLTVEEKDLKTIFLGFNQNLIHDQLKIINNLKIQFRKNNFSEKIDNIDLTNPDKPKIKVFKH